MGLQISVYEKKSDKNNHTNFPRKSQSPKSKARGREGKLKRNEHIPTVKYLLRVLVKNGRFELHVLVEGSNNYAFLALFQSQNCADCAKTNLNV